MYLDFLSAIVSLNQLNPIMQRAKNDRLVLRALTIYDNDKNDLERLTLISKKQPTDQQVLFQKRGGQHVATYIVQHAWEEKAGYLFLSIC